MSTPFPKLLAGIAILLVAGMASAALPEAIAQSTPSAPAVRIEGGVEGVVRSDLGGVLGGATVVASGKDGSVHRSATDQAGRYVLGLPAGTWSINASAPGYAPHKAEVVVVAAGTVQNFTLKATGPVVRGVVTDGRTGSPLAGAIVELHQNQGCGADMACPAMESGKVAPEYYRLPTSTTTGSDGKFALAASQAGQANLRASKENHRDAWEGVEIKEGGATRDLKLLPYPARSAVLEGRVVDAKTGQPLAQAWVSAWPNHAMMGAETPTSGGGTSGSSGSDVAASPAIWQPHYEGNSTQTDREGRFRMAMHPGTYSFQVGANEHGQHREDLTLADGETRKVEARLEPIPGNTVTLQGKVVDKATGKAVAYAWVSVENQRWGHYEGAQADEQGNFQVKTKPGWTMVWVRVDGGYGYAQPVAMDQPGSTEPAQGSATSVVAPDDRRHSQPEGAYYPWVKGAAYAEGQTADLRVELQPKAKADVRIVGYVLNATSKKPLAGAGVNVHNHDTGDWGYATTDKDGSFVLLGRAGMHTVQAHAQDHFQNAVVVEVKGPQTRVDLALEPGQGQGWCCIAYAEKGALAQDGAVAPGQPTSSGAPTSGAPGSAPGPSPPQQGEAGIADNDRAAATYQASGEGLGPYQASTAPPPGQATTTGSGANATPGIAGAAVLAAVGAAALLVGRRRGQA